MLAREWYSQWQEIKPKPATFVNLAKFKMLFAFTEI